MDGAERVFLVAVHVGVAGEPGQVRMHDALGHQVGQRRALAERLRQADVRPLEQRRLARGLQAEQRAHLRVQARIRERIGRELIAQEVADHGLGIGDGIEHRGQCVRESAVSSAASSRSRR
jgi:hypothetical protein